MKLVTRITLPILAGWILSAPLAQAENELNPIVVSATGYEQPLSDVLPSITVITRDQINKSQATSFVDLLQGEPGFEFGRNGGPGTTTSIFLRGADSKNMVVLIDGIRAHTDNIGSVNLTDIPLNNIDRIEILRGNASALYGEAAVGGVINIYTLSGKGAPSGYGKATYGSRNTTDIAAGYGGVVGDIKFNFSASQFYTDGFSARSTSSYNLDKDGYNSQAISGNISRKIARQTEIGANINVIKSHTDYDAYSTTTNDVFTSNTENISAYIKTSIIDSVVSKFEIRNSNFTYKDFKNGNLRTASDYVDGLQKGRQSTYSLSNFYEVNPFTNITFGADVSNSTYALSSYTNATNYRDLVGFYTGLHKTLGALQLQANVRRDDLDAGRENGTAKSYGKTTYLLGAGYKLTNQHRLTATRATGFRAPAPAEFSGTPSLKPELSNTYEVGYDYKSQQSRFRLVYFDTSATDAIYYNPNTDTYGNYNVKNHGLESMGEITLYNITSRLSYTHQNPINTDLNIQQARRAKDFGSLQLSKDIEATSLGAKLIWSGSRKDSDYSSTRLAGYTVLNLFISQKLDKEWTTRLLIENIFDEKYELASNYNTPGRGVFVTLQYLPK